MPKKYQITWSILDQATPVVRKGEAALKAMERQALKTAQAVERAVTRSGKAGEASAASSAGTASRASRAHATAAQKIDVGYYKAVVNGIKYQDKLSAAAQKRADLVASVEQRYAVKDYQARVRAEKQKQALDDFARSRDQKRISGLEGIESAYMARDYRRRVAMERRNEEAALGPLGRVARVRRAVLDDEQVRRAAMVRLRDVRNKRRVDAVLRENGEGQDSFGAAIAGAVGLGGAATAAGAAVMAIGAGAAGVRALAGALAEAHANARKLSEATLEYMVRLRPLASVMGRKPDVAFAKEIAHFGVETGMGKDQAAGFLETFAGRANITRGKQIGDEAGVGPDGKARSEYQKFARMAGRLTTARGVPAAIAGDLFASVLKIENFKAKGQGAKEATARAGGLLDILDAGSGKIESLVPQAVQLMASLAAEDELEGVFRNAGEVGVVTSLMAENNPEEAAVFGRATIKALSRFSDKKRQPFYARAGITPAMSGIERIQAANRVFEEEVAKGVPLEKVLGDFGLDKDVREKTGLMTAYKARKTVLEPQLQRMRDFERPGKADEVEASTNARFRDEDVISTVDKAAVEEAQIRPKGFHLAHYRKKAEEALIASDVESTVMGQLDMRMLHYLALGQKEGRDVAIDRKAMELAAKDAGVDRNGLLSAPANAIYGDLETQINALVKVMEKNAKLAEEAAKVKAEEAKAARPEPKAPAALPVGPPAGKPLRPEV